ncbi:ATP-binding protein [Pseudidiomarina salinarum]|nr:ATP-binding protein [Pseudidiomarina salinarum]RUO71244.1 hypothetical protein CWI79_07400 [Pseudidiomarina salinarum]
MSTSVYINDKYKSSVRIDAVTDNFEAFLDAVIIHGTMRSTISTVSREIQGSSQRAFTVTGPYGSGKSTLAALISGAVGRNDNHRRETLDKFKSAHSLDETIEKGFPYKSGWGVVKHVCGLSKPAQSIAASVCGQLDSKVNPPTASTSDTDCLKAISNSIQEASKSLDGVVILLDELGKALDYQSSHDGDLYFFQELADLAQKSDKPVIIIGFLHQAFNQYAKGKAALTQQEWAKVQGRYRDLSYNPTVDESLILIADSIKVEPEVEKRLLNKYIGLVDSISTELPPAMSATTPLLNALPIDPIVSLLLGPISRRRFSQNERSIFGFLASSERYGFRWFLENKWSPDSLSLYGPDLLWDYLETNLGHLINSSPDGKAWLEANDAIYRAGAKNGDLYLRLTSFVALLTVFGQSFHLYATRELLIKYYQGCGFEKQEIEDVIDDLEKSSVLIFRKKHNALFVFQGSDVDVNELIANEIESIKEGVNWANECTSATHILASSHYHRTGAMRWVATRFVEYAEAISNIDSKEKPKAGEPFSAFVLIGESLNQKELKKLSTECPRLLLGSPTNISKLKSSAIESIAINNVFKREDRLAHDHVARKELNSRLSDARHRLSNELDALFASAKWFYQGEARGIAPLSQLASLAADSMYHRSPIVINELVNRSKPSGNANSATNKLMLAMLKNESEPDLGFDENTFPPEKGVYLSVLKSKGWHQKTPFGYAFVSDWSSELKVEFEDAYRLWESGFNFIKSAEKMVTLSDLYEMWMSPPFGLTAGLCRIYALALLKSLEGKVAFYDKDSTQSFIFIPQLDEVIVEKLHKHAQEVAVRYFEIDSIQTNVVRSIATAAELKSKKDSNLLELAKHIVKLIHTLPPWVKKTSGQLFESEERGVELSKEAKALRNSVLRANDPYKLVLEDIPAIFDVSGNNESSKESINELSIRLKSAIDELMSQHTLLIDAFKQVVRQELDGEFDQELASRSFRVANAAHRPTIREFSTRLNGYINGKNSFEWIVSTALGAAERSWTDKHISNGLHEIYNLCRQFRREETFSKLTSTTSAKSVGLITTDKAGGLVELEGHISKASENDPKLESLLESVSEELKPLSNDLKREVLVRLLSELMHPVEALEASDD